MKLPNSTVGRKSKKITTIMFASNFNFIILILKNCHKNLRLTQNTNLLPFTTPRNSAATTLVFLKSIIIII